MTLEEDSHMAKHWCLDHKDEEKPDFEMKVLRGHMSAFSRQVHEAVLIEMNEGNNILNSKGEFNRCQLPRLCVQMGERPVKEMHDQEMMTAEEIEKEISEMKSKKRNGPDDDQIDEKPQSKGRKRFLGRPQKRVAAKRDRDESQAIEENIIGKRQRLINEMYSQKPEVEKEIACNKAKPRNDCNYDPDVTPVATANIISKVTQASSPGQYLVQQSDVTPEATANIISKVTQASSLDQNLVQQSEN